MEEMDLPSVFKKKEEYHSAQSDSCPWSEECGTEGHKQKVRDGRGVSQNATTQK